jgi:hypothetical protein
MSHAQRGSLRNTGEPVARENLAIARTRDKLAA